VWRALCQGVALTDPKWQNSAVLGGDPVGQVGAVKEQPGYDIIADLSSSNRPGLTSEVST
jgi:hypothetical protein